MSIIKKPAQLLVPQTVRTLIYGQPGIGKTTLSLSAPAPLLLDFDKGVHRVNASHQTDTVQIQKWEDVIEVLKEDLSAYKTLVMDTAGKMLDFMTTYLIENDPKLAKRDGSLQLQGYGARKVMFSAFLNTVSAMGKHLVFVAHDKEEKDGDTRFVRPEIGGSSGGDLMREIDLVGYMEAIGKKRTISFDPTEKFYGKNTCNLEALINLPDLNKAKNTFLTTVFEQYKKTQEERQAMAIKYFELIDHMKGFIDGSKTAEELNKNMADMAALEPIWDSKLQLKQMISEHAKKINLVFDKIKKCYVAGPDLSTNSEVKKAVANV